MITPQTFFMSILGFFCRLWASVAVLFVSQEESTDHSQDIESGIPVPAAAKGPGKVIDITKETPSDMRYLAPSASQYMNVDLKGTEPTKPDPPIRRPSRRASSVHPLKSRIMDATYKQVQDKTINFIKTVELTPSAIVAHPCTAKIEYYEPRYHTHGKRTAAESKAKGNPRVVQFALPPIIVENVSTCSVSTISEDDNDYEPSRRRTKSISDLLDLFPLPPTYVPPTPPPAAAIRQVTENLRNFSAIRVYSPAKAEDESIDSSETESTTSTYSSVADSDVTANTSVPGSPLPNKDGILDLSYNDSPGAFIDEVAPSSTIDTPTRSSELLKQDKPLLPAESSSCLIKLPTVVDNLALSVPHLSDALLVLSKTAVDLTVLSVQTIEEPDHHIPKGFSSALNPRGLIERSHNVVDDFSQADLQKGDIFDETCSKDKNNAPAPKAGLQDLLKTSPSEDAIVDDLLAGLENSLEIDELRMESMPYFEAAEGLLAIVSPEVDKVDTSVMTSVAPLRIVKKNPVQPSTRFEEEPNASDFSGMSWEESLEKVLQAFKDAEAEDKDFHDLFYRDSSFLSQSSMASTMPRLFVSSSASPTPVGTPEERLRRLDESFESVEKSVEELLAELELLPDTVTINTGDEEVGLNSSLEVIQEIQDIVEDAVKSGPESVHSVISLADSSEEDMPYAQWIATLQDSEDEELKSTEGESQDSQWSDLLGLDVYTD